MTEPRSPASFYDRARSTTARAASFGASYAAGAAAAVYLLTLGVRRRPDRAMLRRMAEHVGTLRPPSTRLPIVSLRELAPGDTCVALPEPEGVDGNVTLLELLCLARLARTAAAHAIFEIGTFDGRTTLTLAVNAPSAVVHTLDLPPDVDTAMRIETSERAFVDKPASGARFLGRPEAARIRQHFGDSAAFDYTALHGTIDVAFVDGSHAYEYVLSDSRHALALLRPTGGVLAWHDYGVWPGVTRALEELAREPTFAGMRHVAGTTLAVLDTRARSVS